MATYRSPGVYVEERSVFPPSVAEVETAIPAFIGYTEKAVDARGNDLTNKPTKIRSMPEFVERFGGPHLRTIDAEVTLDEKGGVAAVGVKVREAPNAPRFVLSHAVQHFFENGGGQCYVASVGRYADTTAVEWTSAGGEARGLKHGVDAVAAEDEPTLLVAPDAALAAPAVYADAVQGLLAQCEALGDRFAILDVRDGDAESFDDARGRFGSTGLKYGAAYYPFVRSSFRLPVTDDYSNVSVTTRRPDTPATPAVTLNTLAATDSIVYNAVRAELARHFVVVPPSGAVAGVYAATDAARGVWKAPANVALNAVIEPVARVSDAEQAGLNVDPTAGKSINAIRSFTGRGTLVWGARTLAGNDNEWRYVPVRRFFNTVEESIKKSTYWAVFEPNDANTWVRVRGMIENYLTEKWREGALAGATTKEAFFVRCGLGTTMKSQDILEGRLLVEIGLAVVRPAEFVVLTFSHKLQTS